jgi:hypothetical protein
MAVQSSTACSISGTITGVILRMFSMPLDAMAPENSMPVSNEVDQIKEGK